MVSADLRCFDAAVLAVERGEVRDTTKGRGTPTGNARSAFLSPSVSQLLRAAGARARFCGRAIPRHGGAVLSRGFSFSARDGPMPYSAPATSALWCSVESIQGAIRLQVAEFAGPAPALARAWSRGQGRQHEWHSQHATDTPDAPASLSK